VNGEGDKNVSSEAGEYRNLNIGKIIDLLSAAVYMRLVLEVVFFT
jgi:hypothetical protein